MAPKIPKAKLDAALRAMAAIGVPKETVIPVLKRLLKLFDYNWEHIEADNFLALADAIFDVAESTEEQKRKAETTIEQEHDDKKLKIEQCHEPVPEMLDNERRKLSHIPLRPEQQKAGMLSPHTDSRGKMIETPFQLPSSGVQIKEPKIEPDDAENIGRAENCSVLLLRGQEPPTFEPPLAVMYPPYISSSRDEDLQDPPRFEDSSKGECSSHRNALETSGAEHTNQQNCTHERCIADDSVQRGRSITDACGGPVTVSSKDSSIHFEVASSSSRAVKLSVTCSHSSAECPDFRMPDIESICKEMENRCLRSFKILEPNFSFMNLLKDFCQCIADMGSESVEAREDSIVHIVPAMNSLSTQALHRMPGFGQAGSSNSSNLLKLDGIASAVADGSTGSFGGMQVIKHQLPIDLMRSPHSVDDITKGEESVKIPIVSGIGNEKFPPLFHYIPRNITFQDAYINLSLARIGDENCCSDCFDDCLAKPIPCACATETGGEFAYTRDGLVKEVFLDACVSMLQKPHNHPHYYCKVCPIERAKNELSPDPCKGHLSKKFIKECWSKCGCSRQCGNRVVQRGITCNLQVFLTPEGKGWGLCSVEKLPRGAFICEYVGEILTNTELYDRTIKKTGNARHTYPVLLDADWGTEGVLKDEEALCLDATFYGNVARFINHRCFDANVIGIPVEVETPDHHYYHLAFFTTRQIEPFEELTWDYGIDFDDVDHPIKAFKCRCGSEHCQDKKRISRSRSNALVLR